MTTYVEVTPKDDRNYIEQTLSRAADRTGNELSPEELGLEFATLGIDDRVAALQSLSMESGELSVREAAQRLSYERQLRHIHATLRKVGR